MHNKLESSIDLASLSANLWLDLCTLAIMRTHASKQDWRLNSFFYSVTLTGVMTNTVYSRQIEHTVKLKTVSYQNVLLLLMLLLLLKILNLLK